MRIKIDVSGLPPKKDGANSMWGKGSEFKRLMALRIAAFNAMQDLPLIGENISLILRVFADPAKGDLDNFITGICDGLMAAHPRTPVDLALWNDIPEPARPNRPICFKDDVLVNKISAERFKPENEGEHYSIEVEW